MSDDTDEQLEIIYRELAGHEERLAALERGQKSMAERVRRVALRLRQMFVKSKSVRGRRI